MKNREDPYADSHFLPQTKHIKEALPKHMIHGYLLHSTRPTTDRAHAEAAGKPVLDLTTDAAAYASYTK